MNGHTITFIEWVPSQQAIVGHEGVSRLEGASEKQPFDEMITDSEGPRELDGSE